jgi:trehalose-6-phosphate synthase
LARLVVVSNRVSVPSGAGRINGKYGEVSWTPIRYVNRVHSRSVLAGLYRTARVGLVTPLRDGMNLVAKEYVSAQDPNDPGVLVLSRFAGAAVEGKRALLVNPYDAESVAGAIAQALTMPLEERRERHAALLRANSEHNVNKWQTDFLNALRIDDPTRDEIRATILDEAAQLGSSGIAGSGLASRPTRAPRGRPPNTRWYEPPKVRSLPRRTAEIWPRVIRNVLQRRHTT